VLLSLLLACAPEPPAKPQKLYTIQLERRETIWLRSGCNGVPQPYLTLYGDIVAVEDPTSHEPLPLPIETEWEEWLKFTAAIDVPNDAQIQLRGSSAIPREIFYQGESVWKQADHNPIRRQQ
jgi:hypothetical protein